MLLQMLFKRFKTRIIEALAQVCKRCDFANLHAQMKPLGAVY